MLKEVYVLGNQMDQQLVITMKKKADGIKICVSKMV